MKEGRFGKLEIGEGKGQLRGKKEKSRRFEYLEVGGQKIKLQVEKKKPPSGKIKCPKCAAMNDKGAKYCWLCYTKFEKPKTAEQKVTLVIEGREYSSDDKNLPEDIQWLLEKVKERGYSQQLIQRWQERRKKDPLWKRARLYGKHEREIWEKP